MAKPLNGAQFSQLQLPGTNVKPTAEHRWPRGYTPERQAEVRQAMTTPHGFSTVKIDPGTVHPWTLPTPKEGVNLFTKPIDIKQQQQNRRQMAARRTQDAIARSTTPVEELTGGGEVQRTSHIDKSLRTLKVSQVQFQFNPREEDRAGSYSTSQFMPGSGGREVTEGRINLSSGYDAEYTLLHELGHHRSVIEGNPHSDYAAGRNRTPGGSVKGAVAGQEEAFADKSSAERLVRRRGDDKPTVRPHDYAFHSGYSHFTAAQKKVAARSYVDAYPSRSNDYRRQKEATVAGQAAAREHVEERAKLRQQASGQGRLFMRRAEGGETEREKDFGQWPLYRPIEEEYERTPSMTGRSMGKGVRQVGEEDIGTITVGRKKK